MISRTSKGHEHSKAAWISNIIWIGIILINILKPGLKATKNCLLTKMCLTDWPKRSRTCSRTKPSQNRWSHSSTPGLTLQPQYVHTPTIVTIVMGITRWYCSRRSGGLKVAGWSHTVRVIWTISTLLMNVSTLQRRRAGPTQRPKRNASLRNKAWIQGWVRQWAIKAAHLQEDLTMASLETQTFWITQSEAAT